MSKVVAFTASPRCEGNTYQSLQMVIAPLEAAGIEVEVIDVYEILEGGLAGAWRVFIASARRTPHA